MELIAVICFALTLIAAIIWAIRALAVGKGAVPKHRILLGGLLFLIGQISWAGCIWFAVDHMTDPVPPKPLLLATVFFGGYASMMAGLLVIAIPRFRKLRVAFATVCGIACVLLIVLWASSYTRRNEILFKIPYGDCNYWLTINSFDGRLQTVIVCFDIDPAHTSFDWATESVPIETRRTVERQEIAHGMTPRRYTLGFSYHPLTSGADIIVPHWSAVAFFTVLAAAAATPWIRWRFSLRTLLVTTTLVAAVMGLIVWAIH